MSWSGRNLQAVATDTNRPWRSRVGHQTGSRECCGPCASANPFSQVSRMLQSSSHRSPERPRASRSSARLPVALRVEVAHHKPYHSSDWPRARGGSNGAWSHWCWKRRRLLEQTARLPDHSAAACGQLPWLPPTCRSHRFRAPASWAAGSCSCLWCWGPLTRSARCTPYTASASARSEMGPWPWACWKLPGKRAALAFVAKFMKPSEMEMWSAI